MLGKKSKRNRPKKKLESQQDKEQKPKEKIIYKWFTYYENYPSNYMMTIRDADILVQRIKLIKNQGILQSEKQKFMNLCNFLKKIGKKELMSDYIVPYNALKSGKIIKGHISKNDIFYDDNTTEMDDSCPDVYIENERILNKYKKETTENIINNKLDKFLEKEKRNKKSPINSRNSGNKIQDKKSKKKPKFKTSSNLDKNLKGTVIQAESNDKNGLINKKQKEDEIIDTEIIKKNKINDNKKISDNSKNIIDDKDKKEKQNFNKNLINKNVESIKEKSNQINFENLADEEADDIKKNIKNNTKNIESKIDKDIKDSSGDSSNTKKPNDNINKYINNEQKSTKEEPNKEEDNEFNQEDSDDEPVYDFKGNKIEKKNIIEIIKRNDKKSIKNYIFPKYNFKTFKKNYGYLTYEIWKQIQIKCSYCVKYFHNSTYSDHLFKFHFKEVINRNLLPEKVQKRIVENMFKYRYTKLVKLENDLISLYLYYKNLNAKTYGKESNEANIYMKRFNYIKVISKEKSIEKLMERMMKMVVDRNTTKNVGKEKKH